MFCTSTLVCSLHGYSLMELDKVVKADSEVDEIMKQFTQEQHHIILGAAKIKLIGVRSIRVLCVLQLFCYTQMIEHCTDIVQTFHLQYIDVDMVPALF